MIQSLAENALQTLNNSFIIVTAANAVRGALPFVVVFLALGANISKS